MLWLQIKSYNYVTLCSRLLSDYQINYNPEHFDKNQSEEENYIKCPKP